MSGRPYRISLRVDHWSREEAIAAFEKHFNELRASAYREQRVSRFGGAPDRADDNEICIGGRPLEHLEVLGQLIEKLQASIAKLDREGNVDFKSLAWRRALAKLKAEIAADENGEGPTEPQKS
jgi:hypothetical protein